MSQENYESYRTQSIMHFVRVQVLRSHSISINAEFESSVNIPDARDVFNNFPGVVLMDSPNENLYPTPIQLTENESCAVRLRVDQALSNGLSLWVVGDQLWKGAAQNAIQIAESLVNEVASIYLLNNWQ